MRPSRCCCWTCCATGSPQPLYRVIPDIKSIHTVPFEFELFEFELSTWTQNVVVPGFGDADYSRNVWSNSADHRGTFYYIPVWISSHMHGKVCDGIACPFQYFKGCIVEVWNSISHFIPHFMVDVITYLYWDIWAHHDWPSLMHSNLLISRVKARAIAIVFWRR